MYPPSEVSGKMCVGGIYQQPTVLSRLKQKQKELTERLSNINAGIDALESDKDFASKLEATLKALQQ